MTLDPVHFDGIADLARRVRRDVDEDEHRDLAERVWTEFLDPLYRDGEAVLEPVDERQRFCAAAADLGLAEPAFETVHGLDSGTLNPTTFTNGLVVDVAHAAMSASPSDLTLHRERTIVKGVHTNDATVAVGSDWQQWDQGNTRGRVAAVPDVPDVRPSRAVHWLTLYRAESAHAVANADRVEELLLLDGPLYPKELVSWADRGGGLAALVADEPMVERIVGDYVGLIERFAERGVPVAGFVKSGASNSLVRALDGRLPTPWANDMALFAKLLAEGAPERGLAWTNWFRSALGADGAFGAGADPGVERDLDPADYEVVFFVCHDRRTDLTFKVELPGYFARDPAVRAAVQRQVLGGVAAEEGPPPAIARADSLARIGRGETASLVDRLERTYETREDRNYDDEREW